jgi:hypothetical protein
MLPGTTSEEIDNILLNDSNMKEGNERFYIYPQELYTRLLISKQDLKFEKPNLMGEDIYKYKWLRTYTAIVNQLLVDLGNLCSCPKITAGPDWEFLCIVHGGKKGMQYCPVNNCAHNLESFQTLLTDRFFYWDRGDIKGKTVQAFLQMFKNIHRMIAYTYYSHKVIFNKYEQKYRLNERFLFFCKKFNILEKKHILI